MMVRAAVLRGFGAPFSIEEVDVPVREGDRVVAVRATGICGRDVVVWRGGFRNLRPPLILGHEVFGVDEEGNPVGVYPGIVDEECLRAMRGRETLCPNYSILGEGRPGGYATHVAVPAANLVRLPTPEFEKYAASVCGVATFIHASRVAGVRRGDRVLVTGASGGVGIHGVQYLINVVGAQVYAHVRSEWKAKVLRDLGAAPVTDLGFYRREGRVDFVFEIVGAPTINDSLLALNPGGTLVLVGNVTGEEIRLTRPAVVVMRELKIVGTAAYTLDEYAEAVRLVSQGAIRPFYRTYRLADVNAAYEAISRGELLGRAVLVP